MRAGYKQTEVGVIPEDWNVNVLADIAATSSGTTPARDMADRYYRSGSVNWVKTLDLNNSEIFETDEKVTEQAVEETSLRPYPAGTVLVAMYGGFNQIGRTGLLRIQAAVNQAITAVQPSATKLHSEFLLAVLNFKVDYWKTVASSSRKDPNITSQDVRAFPIANPTLPEQRAIANALSDVDALLSKLEALIAKKRDLKQATMQQLLTGQTRLPGFSGAWEVKRLGDVAHIKTGAKNNDDKVEGGEYPLFVRSQDVERIDTYSYDCEAILVPGEGGIGSIFHYINGKFDCHQRVYKISAFNADTCGKFIFFCMKHFFHIQASRNSVKATVDSLRLPTFLEFEVAAPRLAEQQAIVETLDDMDAELTALEARRDKTRALKQGMMQELLTGRIRLVPAESIQPKVRPDDSHHSN